MGRSYAILLHVDGFEPRSRQEFDSSPVVEPVGDGRRLLCCGCGCGCHIQYYNVMVFKDNGIKLKYLKNHNRRAWLKLITDR